MNKKDDNYYDSFRFLQGDRVEESNRNNSNQSNKRIVKNAMTLDQLNKNVNMDQAIKNVMTSQDHNDSDPTLLRKSEAQLSLESKELNKKLRTQTEYSELNASHPKKDFKSKAKKELEDIQNLIQEDDFNVNRFKNDKMKKKILFNEMKKYYGGASPNNLKKEESTKTKIFRIKKKKNIDQNLAQNIIDIGDKESLIQKGRNKDYKTAFFFVIFCTSAVFIGVYFKFRKPMKKIIN